MRDSFLTQANLTKARVPVRVNAAVTTKEPTRRITIFTPSFADENDTNAQDLTVKEIVARLPPELFRVIMISEGKPDPRIAARKNTKLLPYYKHGNMAQLLIRGLAYSPDVYFYPRTGPLDQALFMLRKKLRLRMAVVTHIVMVVNDVTGNGLVARSIVEGDAVLANSAYVAETVQQRFGVQPGTIYNGIDRRFFFSRHAPSPTGTAEPLTVLYAGSFQPRKRVELVVQQAARWPHVLFRLVGRGETENACRALTAQLQCRNVEFLGHLPAGKTRGRNAKGPCFPFPKYSRGSSPGARASRGLRLAGGCHECVPARVRSRRRDWLSGRVGYGIDPEFGCAASRFCDPTIDGVSRHPHSQKFDWDQIAQQWITVFQDVVAERQGILNYVRNIWHVRSGSPLSGVCQGLGRAGATAPSAPGSRRSAVPHAHGWTLPAGSLEAGDHRPRGRCSAD